ncbi:MAG: hypothetical protein M1549_01300 [Candidatus Dependentiae bacterium]|nr:hypothetical protein [Candidatus Dependentiae bacterium]
MSMIIRIKQFIEELDPKRLYQYLAGMVAGILLLVALLFYLGHREVVKLQDEINTMNRFRTEARRLLGKNAVINERKKLVDEILAQDQTFYIGEYFQQVLTELNLKKENISKEPDISSPQDLKNEYSEVRLDVGFTGITMQQLCDLMYRLEKNRRVFIKEVSITKSFSQPTIGVSLVIATLQSTARL